MTSARWSTIADTIVSVCPPEAALAQARQVAELGFTGVYVDANATSPATAETCRVDVRATRSTAASWDRRRSHPARRVCTCPGSRAADVARRWEGSVLDARVVGAEPGAASALKMCYAAWTKGDRGTVARGARASRPSRASTPISSSEWDISQPDLLQRANRCGPGQHAEGVAFRRRDGRDRGDVP